MDITGTSIAGALAAKLSASAMSAINLTARVQRPIAALALHGARVSPWSVMRRIESGEWFASFTANQDGACYDAIWIRPGAFDTFQHARTLCMVMRGDTTTCTWHTALTPLAWGLFVQ